MALAQRYGIVLILIAAAGVRFWGIDFGLPHLYHADEPMWINQAMAYGAGRFVPIALEIPPLSGYLLFFCFGLYFVFLKLTGVIAGAEDFGRLFIQDPSSFYLIARAVFGAFLGTFQIYIAYRLVRKVFTENQALLTALFYAFNFVHVRNSHYFYQDIPLLLILLLAYFPIYRILQKPVIRDYVIFGTLLGAAVAMKYNGFFIVIPFILAHCSAHHFRIRTILNKETLAAAAVSVTVFLILNPLTWYVPELWFRDFVKMRDFTGFQGYFLHFTYSLKNALEPPYLLLACAGVLFALTQKSMKKYVFLSFPLVYYIILIYRSQDHDRYVLPLTPFMAFFAAEALIAMKERLKWRTPVIVLVAVMSLAPVIYKVVLSNRLFSAQDVRTTALKGVEATIPAGSRIAMNTPFQNPRLKPTVEQLKEKLNEVRAEGSKAKIKRLEWMIEAAEKDLAGRYELYFLSREEDLGGKFLFAKPRIAYDYDKLKEAGIQYVLYARINPSEQRDFFSRLEEEAQLVRRFSPYRDPEIEWDSDSHIMTGGPSLFRELLKRKQNGYVIELYRIP